MSHRDFELWSPPWFGEGLDRHARRLAAASREKQIDSLARLLNTAGTFWYSHMAIGQCSVPAVLEHVMLLTQISEERSFVYALRYELLFLDHVRLQVKKAAKIRLNDELSRRVPDLWQQILLADTPRDRAASAAPQSKTRGNPPALPAPLGAPHGDTRPKNPKGPPPRRPPVRQFICLDHDPRAGKSCSTQGCTHSHLDTTIPANAERFDQVIAIRTRNIRRARQPPGKGDGKGRARAAPLQPPPRR